MLHHRGQIILTLLQELRHLTDVCQVTMTGDFSSARTRHTLLYADGGRNYDSRFRSESINYPTGNGWHPKITYDGDYVYLDQIYDLHP